FERNSDPLHDADGNAVSPGRFHLLLPRPEGAKADKKRQREILDEDRLNQQTRILSHHTISVRWTSWI
ncbi:MAG: hypothetical protein QNL90_06400, partial [Gammaproteobacteria bacterium]|nr:hypothetical protein [Gammaproteobacteria bacterium]MDX2459760.1 hypothetical protein [Gammaproteobacteria bacterium]